MDYGRQTTSTADTVDLRFDDDDFREALRADAFVEEGPAHPVARPIARRLGVDHAEDYDFEPLNEANTVLVAKAGRTADQANRVVDAARRERGDGLVVAAYERGMFSSWVVSVRSENPAWAPPGLSSRRPAEREAAFGDLPEWLADLFLVRVRVHEERAKAGPMRDPAKMVPKGEAGPYQSDTTTS